MADKYYGEKMPTDKLQVNLGKMLISLVVLLVVITLGTVTFTTKDPLWWLSGFTQRPIYVIVYNNGQKTSYSEGIDGYDILANAVVEVLNSGVSHNAAIGLSKESLADAYNKYMTVEAYFDPPAKLHTFFDTGNPTMMLFPITGRHSDESVVFLGVNGMYGSNVPVMKNYQPLRDALKQLGYTVPATP